MHYNILLLPKSFLIVLLSYSLWKVMHYTSFRLLFVTWSGLAYLFLITKSKNKYFWQL